MKQILALIALLTAMLLASVDMEPQTPVQVEYDEILIVETALETEAVFSREAEEIVFEEWHVTGYCACEECCGKTDGVTASGETVTEGITIAADSSIPFGTKIWIEGFGVRTVQDRGSAIGKNEIDIYFSDHDQSRRFGSQYLKVGVLS